LSELRYKLTNDILFKMLFTQHQNLLKQLVSELLSIPIESIMDFIITNPDMPPEVIGDKYCHLDINMKVNSCRIDLEIQVERESDYKERTLYYWARDYSSALQKNMKYSELPRTIIVSILDKPLFVCGEFHSEFQPLEVRRGELLTNTMSLQYFELSKLPEVSGPDDKLKLWLSLFKAKTTEDLEKIIAMGVPVMQEAINAYQTLSEADRFRELERTRHFAEADKASALANARDEGRAIGRDEGRAMGRDEGRAIGYREAEERYRDEIARLKARLGEIN